MQDTNDSSIKDDSYRILSPTAILGYGFPAASFDAAMALELDLIAVDAGSMDAGPYYLGTSSQYVGKAALERDLSFMVNGALQQNCPMVVGSAGFSGASPAMDEVVNIIKSTLKSAGVDEAKLAVIKSDIAPQALLTSADKLEALGKMPELEPAMLEKSALVGQMGMEPIIAALEAGAQFVVCGRAYDPAVFAADPVRKRFPIGAALHAGKILECGAIACEPGSGSDCLVAELYADGRAEFFAPNENRKATIKSISAHTLYEKSRPDIFYLPGGMLDIRATEFYAVDEHKAGFKGSQFIPMPYSIKIEGSASMGTRCLSVAFAKTDDLDEEGVIIYGVNGIEENPPPEGVHEIGILCEVKGNNQQQTKDAVAFLRSTLLHFGYDGRISTAGNLAFPFSPSDFIFGNSSDGFTGFFISGTRDPIFQKNIEQSFESVLDALHNQHPKLAANCNIEFHIGTKDKPLLLIENQADNLDKAIQANAATMQNLASSLDTEKPIYKGVDGGTAYHWSVHHLLKEEKVIEKLFPIDVLQLKQNDWVSIDTLSADYSQQFQDTQTLPTLNTEPAPLPAQNTALKLNNSATLQELANVVRSKNAGINELTFDMLFKSEESYQAALRSGVFSREAIAQLFQLQHEEVIGTYRYDPVRAIKFTLIRPLVSGAKGERDVFGAQQHARLLGLQIPIE
tara:strand:- start:1042 stop:3090 length:2049 start_codon:yes stop_codon:yes gene_type:complete